MKDCFALRIQDYSANEYPVIAKGSKSEQSNSIKEAINNFYLDGMKNTISFAPDVTFTEKSVYNENTNCGSDKILTLSVQGDRGLKDKYAWQSYFMYDEYPRYHKYES